MYREQVKITCSLFLYKRIAAIREPLCLIPGLEQRDKSHIHLLNSSVNLDKLDMNHICSSAGVIWLKK